MSGWREWIRDRFFGRPETSVAEAVVPEPEEPETPLNRWLWLRAIGDVMAVHPEARDALGVVVCCRYGSDDATEQLVAEMKTGDWSGKRPYPWRGDGLTENEWDTLRTLALWCERQTDVHKSERCLVMDLERVPLAKLLHIHGLYGSHPMENHRQSWARVIDGGRKRTKARPRRQRNTGIDDGT